MSLYPKASAQLPVRAATDGGTNISLIQQGNRTLSLYFIHGVHISEGQISVFDVPVASGKVTVKNDLGETGAPMVPTEDWWREVSREVATEAGLLGVQLWGLKQAVG